MCVGIVKLTKGKYTHYAGFVSRTLLQRHERFEGCPALAFAQSRIVLTGMAPRTCPRITSRS